MPDRKPLILIRGAGEHATGTAHRLFRSGFRVVLTEIPEPLPVRRTVAFATAVYAGSITVEGVTAHHYAALPAGFDWSHLPVLVDPEAACRTTLRPEVLVDARLLKRDIDTHSTDAPLVIGLGPGFVPGDNCHVAIETNRGHDLGRVLYDRAPEADTGIPGAIGGVTAQRCFRAPHAGIFRSERTIGETVAAGDTVGTVDATPVSAAIDGMLRGLLQSGIAVATGTKLGDIDPRGRQEYCATLSDKTRTISGGVLEAILAHSAAVPPSPCPLPPGAGEGICLSPLRGERNGLPETGS